MIKAVIFDLDGTLIDSMGIWDKVDVDFLKKRNIEVPEDLFVDTESGNSINDLAILFKDKFKLAESLDEIKLEWQSMVEDYYRYELKIKPNVIDVLNFLREKNIKLAIGTSNSEHLARAVLSSNKVEDYFEFFSAGCQDIKGKPHPDIYLKAAESIEIAPENCLVIEDSLVGVQAGKNAQMRVFSIHDDYTGKDLERVIELSDQHFQTYSDMHEYFVNKL